MSLLYEIFIKIYSWGIGIASFFNPKAKKWVSGRKKSFEKLRAFSNKYPKNIWIHCASTGELEQGIPVIKKLQKENASYQILISFFSPSGYEYAQSKYPDWNIIYLPIDTKKNAAKWISILKPQLAVFIKYEFWHFYFKTLNKTSIPLLMVSAIFWEKLFFFKWYGRFFQKSLKQVTHFFVQNNESKNLLESIKISNVSVTGDTRFEQTLSLKEKEFENLIIKNFISDKKVFVAGSAWDGDVKLIKKIISNLPEDWKIIIAPHEIDHFSYDAYSEFDSMRYTQIKGTKNKRLLFLDTIGILSNVYRFSSIVYVGGGFGKGIHNLLEAAVYNIPIICGPNMQRFEEAKILKKIGVLNVVNENQIHDLGFDTNLCLSHEEITANQEFFSENANVSDQIMVFIKKRGFLD